jgi:zinc protease
VTAELVTQRPEPAPPRPWRFPEFERREVGCGRVIACHLPGKPLAVVTLVFDAGAVTEPAAREGVAGLLAAALSEGTTSRDAYDFALAAERLGAGWHADADWDSLRCGFEVPVGALGAAAELLAEAVRFPALSDDVLGRVRAERLDDLQLELSQPAPRASAAFAAAVFAGTSRYSTPPGGSVDSVSATGADDIRAFHAGRLAPTNATMVVVGDLADIDVDAVARCVFDGWSGPPAASTTPTVATNAGGRILVIDRPGSVQSMLYAGHDGPPRNIPDYVPTTTMTLALGGMFNSRLNMKLREEKGYAYGAFGSVDCRRHGGVFSARAAVQTEVTGPALADLVTEIRRLHDDGLTEPELAAARSYRAGVFPVNYAGPGAVAHGLGELVVHGHPDDHFDRLRREIEAVSLADVNAAAKTRLRPDDLVAVVVGDADSVLPGLTDAGLGPIEIVRDNGGRPGHA